MLITCEILRKIKWKKLDRKTFLYHKNMLEWDLSIVKALL